MTHPNIGNGPAFDTPIARGLTVRQLVETLMTACVAGNGFFAGSGAAAIASTVNRGQQIADELLARWEAAAARTAEHAAAEQAADVLRLAEAAPPAARAELAAHLAEAQELGDPRPLADLVQEWLAQQAANRAPGAVAAAGAKLSDHLTAERERQARGQEGGDA